MKGTLHSSMICCCVIAIVLGTMSFASLAAGSASADDLHEPQPPVVLTAIPHPHSIELTWTEAVDTEGHGWYAIDVIRRVHDDSSEHMTLAELPLETLSYLDASVQEGMVYEYFLELRPTSNETDDFAWSDWLYISTDAKAPSVPSGFSLTVGSTEAYLRWSMPVDDGGATNHYTVYSGSDPSMLTPLMNVSHQELYWNDGCEVENLTDGEVYFFAVQAINVMGSSNLTEVLSAKPMPAAVIVVTTSCTEDLNYTINVTWNNVDTDLGTVVGYSLHTYGWAVKGNVVNLSADTTNYSFNVGSDRQMMIFHLETLYQDGNSSYSNREYVYMMTLQGGGFVDNSPLFILALLIGAIVFFAVIVLMIRRSMKKNR